MSPVVPLPDLDFPLSPPHLTSPSIDVRMNTVMTRSKSLDSKRIRTRTLRSKDIFDSRHFPQAPSFANSYLIRVFDV